VGHELYRSRSEKDTLEARNGRFQYRRTMRFVEWLGSTLELTPRIIKSLHRAAIKDVYSCAGKYRDGSVRIRGSEHKPPDARYVPNLVDEMCEKVNAETNWSSIETAAYLLWRVNWIHPFEGGNGRTARAVCYLGLCVRHGSTLPGEVTIPRLIVNDREPFLEGLRDADDAFSHGGNVDVSKLILLMDGWLTKQLASVPPPPRPVMAQPRPAPPPFPGGEIQLSAGPPLPPTDE
jgi:Fic/DOC family